MPSVPYGQLLRRCLFAVPAVSDPLRFGCIYGLFQRFRDEIHESSRLEEGSLIDLGKK
jgi:hypothetical protein